MRIGGSRALRGSESKSASSLDEMSVVGLASDSESWYGAGRSTIATNCIPWLPQNPITVSAAFDRPVFEFISTVMGMMVVHVDFFMRFHA